MKLIVLAAGQGTRLRPYTNDKPKCLVQVQGKSILDYQLEACDRLGIHDQIVVAGYKQEKITRKGLKKIINTRFHETNMVSSLFCASDFFDDDIIISYGDIIYSDCVLKKLIDSKYPVSVVVDQNWHELWKLRMENPLSDIESMKISENLIVELGRKVSCMEDVEGQYIGLIKVRKEFLSSLMAFYTSLDRSKYYDGNDFDNMYLTSFIQLVIDSFNNVSPILIQGEWAEIDSVEDLEAYSKADYINKNINSNL